MFLNHRRIAQLRDVLRNLERLLDLQYRRGASLIPEAYASPPPEFASSALAEPVMSSTSTINEVPHVHAATAGTGARFCGYFLMHLELMLASANRISNRKEVRLPSCDCVWMRACQSIWLTVLLSDLYYWRMSVIYRHIWAVMCAMHCW